MAQALHATASDDVTAALLRDASIETSSRDPTAAAQLADWFAPGTDVFINFVPGTDHRRLVDVAIAVRRAGFEPVPHLTARGVAGAAELSAVLTRLAGEAGVQKVLAIAGDVAVPRGPFGSTLEMVESGLLAAQGVKSVGFAGYPEGHHTQPREAVQEALAAKLAAARAQGLQGFIVTQFCFEAAPILAWLGAVRAAGVSVPIRIGVAGPASNRALLTFAMRCGIGTSLRVLLNQPQSIGRLLRDASPDGLIAELAAGLARLAPGERPRLHLFPFGGLAKTGAWRRQAMA
ncbi:MAG TPA: methylenetetrahydrofolate reductase [Xanthobacteraceae bacterium]|nr:methylenetetrahydrofolate reductase [Xanthobacteraceae bacterium]